MGRARRAPASNTSTVWMLLNRWCWCWCWCWWCCALLPVLPGAAGAAVRRAAAAAASGVSCPAGTTTVGERGYNASHFVNAHSLDKWTKTRKWAVAKTPTSADERGKVHPSYIRTVLDSASPSGLLLAGASDPDGPPHFCAKGGAKRQKFLSYHRFGGWGNQVQLFPASLPAWYQW